LTSITVEEVLGEFRAVLGYFFAKKMERQDGDFLLVICEK